MHEGLVSYMSAFDSRDRAILTIADNPDALAAIGESLAALDVRALNPIPLKEASERLARQVGVSAIAIDIVGADDVAALAGLDTVVRAARDHGAGVVASFSPDQIDLADMALAGVGAEMLCAPTVAERIAAFALLAPMSNTLHDATRDSEARRLRQLNDEVARIAETLARLTRADTSSPLPVGVTEQGSGFRAQPAAGDDAIDATDIRAAIRARRMRDQFFDSSLFADPAWDMLLDLFAAHLDETRVSVSSLCIAAAVPATTALRWITTLREAGLFERRDDPFDRRRAYIALSPKAVTAMQDYVGSARRAGLAIA